MSAHLSLDRQTLPGDPGLSVLGRDPKIDDMARQSSGCAGFGFQDPWYGVGSFSSAVARRALAAGLSPGTISSDLHFYNVNGPVFDLATTIPKFMLLGLPLDDVLTKTTSVPAQLLGLSDRLGSLRQGYMADIAVFKLYGGDFEFEDSMKEKIRWDQRLEPVAVVRRGRVFRSQLRLDRKYGHRS